MAVYGATKAYVLSFTEALWAEYRDCGVASGSENLKSKRMEPIDVVNAAFKAVEKDRNSIIVGRSAYLMAQLPRILPRSMVIKFTRRLFQSALASSKINH